VLVIVGDEAGAVAEGHDGSGRIKQLETALPVSWFSLGVGNGYDIHHFVGIKVDD
jgi:hypothetical protein